MRKIIMCLIILVLAGVMAFSLVACDKDNFIEMPPDVDNPYKIPVSSVGQMPGAMTALREISASMTQTNGVVSTDILVPLRLNGTVYTVSFKSNTPTDGSSMEVVMQVIKDDDILFGFYINESKMYFEIFDENTRIPLKFHVEDIDVEYLMGLLEKLDMQELLGVLDGALSGLGMTTDALIEMVAPMLFKVTDYKKSSDATLIDMQLDINELLDLVPTLLGSFNLDGLLGGAGINVSGLSQFLIDILGWIPPFHIDIHTIIVNGVNKVFDVSFVTTQELVGAAVSVKFFDALQEIGMPDDLRGYEPFSLTNICFNIDLDIEADNFDVGKFINTFLPDTLPENVLTFTAKDTKFILRLNMDLHPTDNNKNLILLELYKTDVSNSNLLLGAYFVDGVLRVNVNEVSSAISVPNIEIHGLNISGLISDLVTLLTSTIEGALDSLFPGDTAGTSAVSTIESGKENGMIVPINVSASGAAVQPSLSAFIDSLTKLFIMDDFIKYDEDGQSFSIIVGDTTNSDGEVVNFFDTLVKLAPALNGQLPEMLQNIGTGILTMNFSEAGIDNIDLSYMPVDGTRIGINFNSFLIGFSKAGLENEIRTKTTDKEYVSNVTDLITGALDGVDLQGSLSITLNKGQHNLANVLGGLVTLPPIILDVTETTVLGIDLLIQLSYNHADTTLSRAKIELSLTHDFLFLKKGKLISLYGEGNNFYVDITGLGNSVQIPKIKLNVNVMDLLHDAIESINFDFMFEGLLEGLLPNNGVQGMSNSYNESTKGTAAESIENLISLNKESLTLAITSYAIQQVLDTFDITIDLPAFDIQAEIKDINDIKLHLSLGQILSVNLAINEFNIGKSLDIDAPEAFNPEDYVSSASELISSILKGVDLQANMSLAIAPGTLDLSSIFSLFEVNGDGLVVNVPAQACGVCDACAQGKSCTNPQGLVLDISLTVRMQYNSDPAKSYVFVEMNINEDMLIFKKGTLLRLIALGDGYVYAEISPDGAINGLHAPKLKLQYDLIGTIKNLIDEINLDFSIPLNNMLNPNIKNNDVSTTNATNATDDGGISLVINPKTLQLAVTSQAIVELLAMFKQELVLPEFDITLEISELNNIKLNAKALGQVTLDLSITEFTIGKELPYPVPEINSDEYANSLNDIIQKALEGVSIQAEIDLTIQAGFDLDKLLNDLEITISGMPDISIAIPQDIIIGAKLNVMFAYNEAMPELSMGVIEIWVKENTNIPILDIEKLKTSPLIGIYIQGSNIFLEINGLKGVSIPKIQLQFDFIGMLNNLVKEMTLESILGIGGGGSATASDIRTLAAGDNDEVKVVINGENLQLTATLMALQQLLNDFGLKIDLPSIPLDIELNASSLKDIVIKAEMTGYLAMKLALTDLSIGDAGVAGQISTILKNNFEFDENGKIIAPEYNSNLTEVLNAALEGVEINADLRLQITKDFDLSQLLSLFVSDFPALNITFPAELELQLGLFAQINYNAAMPEKSKAVIEITVNEDIESDALFIKRGLLVGIYIDGNDAYIRLGDITGAGGISGLTLPTVKVTTDLLTTLQGFINGLDIDFVLDTLINGGTTVDNGVGTTNVTVDNGSGIGIEINKNYIKMMASLLAVQELLSGLIPSFDMTLPDMDLTLEIGGLDDIKLNINDGNTLKADINLGIKVGLDNIVMQEFDFGTDFSDNISSIINDVLKGIDLEFDLSLEIPKLPNGQKLNLSEVFSKMGVFVPDLMLEIKENITLDFKLKIQLSADLVNPDNSRGYIALFLQQDALIFQKSEPNKPFLGAYIIGQDVNLEINGIKGLSNATVKLKTNIFEYLAQTIETLSDTIKFDIKFDDLINPKATQTVNTTASTIADTNDSYDKINVSIDKDKLSLYASAFALNQFFASLDLAVVLPDMDVSLIISNGVSTGVEGETIEGITIKLGADDVLGLANAKLEVKASNIGAPIEGLNDTIRAAMSGKTFGIDLAAVIDNLLEGINLEADINFKIPAGSNYDIAGFLKPFNLDIPPLNLSFTGNGLVMKSTMLIQLHNDKVSSKNNKGVIKLTVNNPHEFKFIEPANYNICNGDGSNCSCSVDVFAIYIDGESVYIDLSNVVISNIRLPKVKMNLDVFGMINDIIDGFDIEFLLDMLGITGGGASTVANTDAKAPNFKDNLVNIGISQEQLQIRATAAAIQLLLSQLGLSVELPDFAIDIAIKDFTDIKLHLDAAIYGNNNECVTMDMHLKNTSIGVNPGIILPDNLDKDMQFGSTVIDVIFNMIRNVDISGKIELDASRGTLVLNDLINAFLAPSGQRFDVPISLKTDDYSNALNISLQWQLVKGDPMASKAAIAIYTDKHDLAISIYLENANLYIDLSSLGLMKFYIPNFNLPGLIESMLTDMMLGADGSSFANIDLGNLIDSLLNPTTTVSNQSKVSTLEQISKGVQNDANIKAAMNAAANSSEPLDLLSIIIGALNITDTIISLDFSKDVIDSLFKSAGIRLGIDLFGNIEFNLNKGQLDGNLVIDGYKLGLNFNLKKFGELDDSKNIVKFIDFAAAKVNNQYVTSTTVPGKNSYVEYSLVSTFDLLTSIFTNVPAGFTGSRYPLLYADLSTLTYQNKGMSAARDYGFESGRGGVIRIKVERIITPQKFHLVNAPAGSIAISVYKNLSNNDSDGTAVLYALLEIPRKNLQIMGTSNIFNVLGQTGDLINVPVSIDLATILGGLLDPIFDSLPDDMWYNPASLFAAGSVKTTADTSTLAEEGALDIASIIKGISIALYDTGTTKIDASINGTFLSDMLVDLFHNLFATLDLGSGPANVDYKAGLTSTNGFFNDVWSRIITPLLKQLLNIDIAGIAKPLVQESIKDLMYRLLPFPRFDDMNATITITDSKIKNVMVNAKRNKPHESDSGLYEQLYLDLYMVEQGSLVNTYDDVDFGTIPGAVTIDPYDNVTNFATMFKDKKATKSVNGSMRKDGTATIAYSGDYNLLVSEFASKNYSKSSYNVVATAFGKSKNIPITVLPKGDSFNVEDVIVAEYAELPNYVILTIKVGDSTVQRRVPAVINAKRDRYADSTVETSITINGESKQFKVHFLDSTINPDVGYNATITIDAYNKHDLVNALPSRVFFKYNSGYYDSMLVQWDTKELDNLQMQNWISGTTIKLTATIIDPRVSESARQTLVYEVRIPNTQVATVQFEGEADDGTLTIDPYAAYSDSASVYPNFVNVTYESGRTERREITWSGNNFEFDNTARVYTGAKITNKIDLPAGADIANYYVWQPIDITIKTISRVFKYIDFNGSRELEVDPYKAILDKDSQFPTTVTAMFEQGGSIVVPCKWDIDVSKLPIGGDYIEVKATIFSGTYLESTKDIVVKINNRTITDIELPKDSTTGRGQLILTDTQDVLYGGKALDYVIARELNFKIVNGDIASLPVTIDTTGVTITKDGGKFLNKTVTVAKGTAYEKVFYIDIIVPSLKVVDYQKEIKLTVEELQQLKDKAFPYVWSIQFETDHTKSLYGVDWNFDRVTIDGGVAEAIIGKGTVNEIRLEVNVVFKQAIV